MRLYLIYFRINEMALRAPLILLRATKLVLSTKIILNYTFFTKYDINAKLPNTQPTEYPT